MKLLVRLAYPRTRTRYDERLLSHHGVKFFHVDEDRDEEKPDKFSATVELRGDRDYIIYGDDIPTRTYETLDECLHYLVGGRFTIVGKLNVG